MSKDPSMWLLFLFFLGISSAAEGGVTLSDARHLPPHDACILSILLCDDFKAPLTHSESSEDLFQAAALERVCRRLSRYIVCMEKAEARCKIDFRRFPISDTMIENRRIAEEMCVPNSKLKEVYLMHSACINMHSNKTAEMCVQKVLEASPETYEKGAYEEECRHDIEMRKCHLKEMKERCGADAAGLLRRLILFRTGLDFQCSIFEEKKSTKTKVKTSNLEKPESHRDHWRFSSFLGDLLNGPTLREGSRQRKRVERLPGNAVPFADTPQKPVSVQSDTVTVTRSTMLVDPFPEDMTVTLAAGMTQADAENTILTTETSLRNDEFPEATASYSDFETTDVIFPDGYVQEVPTVLTTETSLGTDAFPEVTNSYEEDVTGADGSVRGMPSRITTPRGFNTETTTFTTKPSESNLAFLEAQTLHSFPDTVGPILPEGYLHENLTTFGLYEVLDQNESYYLGCGKAKTLWATNLPLKNVFCAWLNVGSSQKLFKCSIQVGESCSPKASFVRLENFPTVFESRKTTLVVYRPEKDEQMTEKATMKMVYFTPEYNPPMVRRNVESFSSRNGFWMNNFVEETVNHGQSGLNRKADKMELEDHLSELEGHQDADFAEEHEFYVPKGSEIYAFDSNGQIAEFVSEEGLQNESEDREDFIPDKHDATARYKSDAKIYVKKNKGDFSPRRHRHLSKLPRINRTPMHSHGLYRPYSLYRPRVGDMADTETNAVDYCSAEGPCPSAADTGSSRMKPKMTDTVNNQQNVESKFYEQTSYSSKPNYIIVGNSFSPIVRGTANAETRPNESKTVYVLESTEDEKEDYNKKSYPEKEDESSTERSVDSPSQRDIKLYTIIRILSDINRVSISIKTVFEGLKYILERNNAPSAYPGNRVLLKEMENVINAHYRTMTRIREIVESDEEFKKYFHSGERFFPVPY